MKTTMTISVEDICEAVWYAIKDKVRADNGYDFSEPDFHFTFDDSKTVTGMTVSTIISTIIYKDDE